MAKTYNQRQVAAALDTLDRTDGSDADNVYMAILFTTNEEALRTFDTASGEIYATILAAQGQGGLSRNDRLLARANSSAPEGWGLWGGIEGGTQDTDSDGNGAAFDVDDFAAELGIDYRGASNRWAAGLALNYLDNSVEPDGRADSADFDGWSLGGYARIGAGGKGVSLSAALDYAAMTGTVDRQIHAGALTRAARSNLEVKTITASAELRYGVDVAETLAIGPIGSVRYAESWFDSLAETGAGALNLSSSSGGDFDLLRAGAGMFVSFADERTQFDLSAQHVFGDSEFASVQLLLEGASSSPYLTRSPVVEGDGLLLQASARHNLTSRLSIGADGRYGASSGQNVLSGAVTLRLGF